MLSCNVTHRSDLTGQRDNASDQSTESIDGHYFKMFILTVGRLGIFSLVVLVFAFWKLNDFTLLVPYQIEGLF